MAETAMVAALFGVVTGSATLTPVPASANALSPRPPKACQIPAGAAKVSNVQQLESALAKKQPQDIEIVPGTYAPKGPLKPLAAHRLWAKHADAVTIRAGFRFTGRGARGFEVHCLTFDINDIKKVDRRNGPTIFDSARGWIDITIADSRLLGNGRIGRAVFAIKSTGLKMERVEVRGFTRDGIRLKAGSGRVVLRDLDISDVERPGAATYKGKAEAGIFIDTAATVERVRVRDAYWMGIGTYANDITVRDLDVDGSIVGVYVEHYTHRLTLENFRIGRDVEKGVNFEWDDPKKYGRKPTSVGALIQDGLVESNWIGVAVNEGQKDPTVRRVTFRGQCAAGIVGYRPRSSGEVYVTNSFSGIKPGAVPISTKPPNAIKCR